MDEEDLISTQNSAKEDRDYLLEYKSVDLKSLRKAKVLDVPVDNISRDEAVAVILDLVEKKRGPHYVLFIDPIKLIRIRPGRKLHSIVKFSRLILPDGAGVAWAARKSGYTLKERIPMIALLMDVIRLAEKKSLTIYLLGSRMEYIEKVFFNLQRSFPGVRIIGRQSGHFNESREKLIKESLRKSSPDIVFVGMGFPIQEKWIMANKNSFSKAVVIGVDGALDILSGQEKKAPNWIQIRGLTWFWRLLIRPWNVKRVYILFRFVLLGFWKSVRKKQSRN